DVTVALKDKKKVITNNIAGFYYFHPEWLHYCYNCFHSDTNKRLIFPPHNELSFLINNTPV
ncbi:hypothetical protein Q4S18_19445, partial [Morganella morganii]